MQGKGDLVLQSWSEVTMLEHVGRRINKTISKHTENDKKKLTKKTRKKQRNSDGDGWSVIPRSLQVTGMVILFSFLNARSYLVLCVWGFTRKLNISLLSLLSPIYTFLPSLVKCG